MYIGANYSTVFGSIWFILGMLVSLHVLYILLIFENNISHSVQLLIFLCSLP